MKKFILALALIIASATFVTGQAQHISVSININSQPAWGPVGYDYVDYYYIPEINVYYNVPMSMFYYWDRGHWISARYLPYAYRHYDLYGMYKVVLNMNNPWYHNRYHVRDYARYKGYRNQHVIYYANDNRYNHSRRNTVSWYEGNKHSKPSKKYDNNVRSTTRSSSNAYNQNRSARVDNMNKKSDNNNRAYNNNNRNNTRSSSNQDKAVRSQRNSSDRNNRSKDNNTRSTTKTRSSNSQTYYVNNAKESKPATTRSSSNQRSSSRSQSERTSSTRSNR